MIKLSDSPFAQEKQGRHVFANKNVSETPKRVGQAFFPEASQASAIRLLTRGLGAAVSHIEPPKSICPQAASGRSEPPVVHREKQIGALAPEISFGELSVKIEVYDRDTLVLQKNEYDNEGNRKEQLLVNGALVAPSTDLSGTFIGKHDGTTVIRRTVGASRDKSSDYVRIINAYTRAEDIGPYLHVSSASVQEGRLRYFSGEGQPGEENQDHIKWQFHIDKKHSPQFLKVWPNPMYGIVEKYTKNLDAQVYRYIAKDAAGHLAVYADTEQKYSLQQTVEGDILSGTIEEQDGMEVAELTVQPVDSSLAVQQVYVDGKPLGAPMGGLYSAVRRLPDGRVVYAARMPPQNNRRSSEAYLFIDGVPTYRLENPYISFDGSSIGAILRDAAGRKTQVLIGDTIVDDGHTSYSISNLGFVSGHYTYFATTSKGERYFCWNGKKIGPLAAAMYGSPQVFGDEYRTAIAAPMLSADVKPFQWKTFIFDEQASLLGVLDERLFMDGGDAVLGEDGRLELLLEDGKVGDEITRIYIDTQPVMSLNPTNYIWSWGRTNNGLTYIFGSDSSDSGRSVIGKIGEKTFHSLSHISTVELKDGRLISFVATQKPSDTGEQRYTEIWIDDVNSGQSFAGWFNYQPSVFDWGYATRLENFDTGSTAVIINGVQGPVYDWVSAVNEDAQGPYYMAVKGQKIFRVDVYPPSLTE